jgi:hypothetical protein
MTWADEESAHLILRRLFGDARTYVSQPSFLR